MKRIHKTNLYQINDAIEGRRRDRGKEEMTK